MATSFDLNGMLLLVAEEIQDRVDGIWKESEFLSMLALFEEIFWSDHKAFLPMLCPNISFFSISTYNAYRSFDNVPFYGPTQFILITNFFFDNLVLWF